MAWIDDGPPYPWGDPVARDLHRRLVDTFYEGSEVRTLVRSAKKPNFTKIPFEGRSIFQIWVDTLDRAAAEGGLRTLLSFIVDEEGASSDLKSFVRELLDAKSPPIAARPDGDGAKLVAPLTVAEALLFGADLSESVGAIPELLASIERVMQWRSAVCHLEALGVDGLTYFGTGMLLTDGRVLTNHHVVFPVGLPAVKVSAKFHFELDAQGQNLASQVVGADLATVKASQEDDWAVFAVAGNAPALVNAFDLAANLAEAKLSERAFILQHPLGKEKRLGFVRNHISLVQHRRVYYVTDTQGGSSGSPVFNGSGQIIALHRAGGVPQKFPGSPTVKNNEGVRLDVVAPAILAS